METNSPFSNKIIQIFLLSERQCQIFLLILYIRLQYHGQTNFSEKASILNLFTTPEGTKRAVEDENTYSRKIHSKLEPVSI